MTEVWAAAALCEYCFPENPKEPPGVHRLNPENVGDPSQDLMALLRRTGALEEVWPHFVTDVRAIDPRMSMVAETAMHAIVNRHSAAFRRLSVNLFYCKTVKMREHRLSSWFEFVDLGADAARSKRYRPQDAIPPKSACAVA
jgi:hypothetical protein